MCTKWFYHKLGASRLNIYLQLYRNLLDDNKGYEWRFQDGLTITEMLYLRYELYLPLNKEINKFTSFCIWLVIESLYLKIRMVVEILCP